MEIFDVRLKSLEKFPVLLVNKKERVLMKMANNY